VETRQRRDRLVDETYGISRYDRAENHPKHGIPAHTPQDKRLQTGHRRRIKEHRLSTRVSSDYAKWGNQHNHASAALLDSSATSKLSGRNRHHKAQTTRRPPEQ